MFLLEPNRTPWDVNFYVGNIPVRVHPLFWLMSLFVVGIGQISGLFLVLGILCVFASILIHELGHAWTMQWYGERPRVILYGMGGLATSQGEGIWDVGYRQRSPRTQWEQIIISFAGPAAGFILAGIVIAGIYLAGGGILVSWRGLLPLVFHYFPPGQQISKAGSFTIGVLLFCNIYWGLMNLLPVYPLDGGQIARQLFTMFDPWEGLRRSLWVSLLVGAGFAVFGLFNGQIWMGLLFGSLAYGSWEALQHTGGYGGRRPW